MGFVTIEHREENDFSRHRDDRLTFPGKPPIYRKSQQIVDVTLRYRIAPTEFLEPVSC
jgi:hypothetical protein